MAQVTKGIRAVLSSSKIYSLFQNILGARDGRSNFSSQYIRSQDGDYVLDIGCGTADIRKYLANVNYYGFDPSARYINTAKANLREFPDSSLFRASIDEAVLNSLPKFDIILAIGVLHHLHDDAVINLASLAKGTLKQEGRLVTLDPCYVDGQSPIARLLIRCDRGLNVRNVNGYHSLMATKFEYVQTDIRHDFNRFPYTHFIMECFNK